MSTAPALGSLTGRIVTAPTGGKQPCRHPRWGQSDFVATPLGASSLVVAPNGGLSRFVDQVPIESRAAAPEVLGDVPRGVTVGLHALVCRETLKSSALSIPVTKLLTTEVRKHRWTHLEGSGDVPRPL
jgi:hypothetical protein